MIFLSSWVSRTLPPFQQRRFILHSIFRLALIAATTILATSADAVGLEGSEVSVTAYCCTAPVESEIISNVPKSIVDDDILEFPYPDLYTVNCFFCFVIPVSIDVSSNKIEAWYIEDGVALPGSFNGYVFRFFGGPEITSVTLNSGSTASPVSIAFTADSVTVDGASFIYTRETHVILDVVTAPVPEPTTWLLLLVGFGVLGVRRQIACAKRLNPVT